MSHLGPPDYCDTASNAANRMDTMSCIPSQEYWDSSPASNMEVSGTESLTADGPITIVVVESVRQDLHPADGKTGT